MSVNSVGNGVRLIRDKSWIDSKMSHPSYDILPVCFSNIQMGFFSEHKDRRNQIPLKQVDQLIKDLASTIIRRTRGVILPMLTTITAPLFLFEKIFSNLISSARFCKNNLDACITWNLETSASRTQLINIPCVDCIAECFDL